MHHFSDAFKFAALLIAILCSGCSSEPPSNPKDLCGVFQEKDSWYAAAHRVHERYGIPIHVAVAIMAQDHGLVMRENDPIDSVFSKFKGEEEGYLTVSDEIWRQYAEEAGAFFCDRRNFGDALDFIGWYMNKSLKKCGVALSDAYDQYLCYREGWEGYNLESYKVKSWMQDAALQVVKRASAYRTQLLQCNLY